MKKIAVLFGNNYEGTRNALNGCFNDVDDMGAFLNGRGYEVETHKEYTKKQFLDAIENAKLKIGKGDLLFLQNSSHGTQVENMDGEEKDGYDEAICPIDLRTNLITDDELRAMLKHPANVFLFADCCHSGTLNRAVDISNCVDLMAKPKFIAPYEFKGKLFKAKKQTPNTFLCISGCTEASVSYDAMINGRYNGALTRTALDVYTEGMSFEAWYKAIRKALPNKRYPQEPQFIGKNSVKPIIL